MIESRFDIGRLGPSDVRPFRALRLYALQSQPEAFGSSYEEEAALPDSAFKGFLTNSAVFGAWSGESLVGCAGLAHREKRKLRHKGILWGMFVRPEARGCGIGKRLLDDVVAHARTCCEEVLLTVVEGNGAAHRLYVRAGFEQYGREPCALKLGADYYHELMMRLSWK